MKRIIYLLPVVAIMMGMLSCDKDDADAPVAAPVIQPNGDYPVDLGLSVKWATCNVGATTPEGYGDYFAWGDTATYYNGYAQSNHPAWKDGKSDGYKVASYKYFNQSSNKITRYCNKSAFGDGGYTDSDTTLFYVDDVAHYKWGGNWRMPTQAEFNELLDSCDCKFTSQNGVYGLKVTSRKYLDRSIFLPAAGLRSETNLNSFETYGHYWSSSLYTDSPSDAWHLIFSNTHNTRKVLKIDREGGLSIRPVCK